jgi:hypothetical protein
MIRAVVWGLAVALLAGILFLLIPAQEAARSARGAPVPEAIVSGFTAQPAPKDSAATIERLNLWGIATPQAAAEAEKITGKIVGAVSTRDTKYVLLQVGKQTPVELKVGDALPVQIEAFGGGKIVDIRSDRITVLKNGETYIVSITN